MGWIALEKWESVDGRCFPPDAVALLRKFGNMIIPKKRKQVTDIEPGLALTRIIIAICTWQSRLWSSAKRIMRTGSRSNRRANVGLRMHDIKNINCFNYVHFFLKRISESSIIALFSRSQGPRSRIEPVVSADSPVFRPA